MLISRLAPTPSGFLHLGNAFNFLLTSTLVRESGGQLRLRIDDLDAIRTRPEYVEDIFETLSWLGIHWEEGPRNARELQTHYSQSLRRERYLAAVQDLLQRQEAYVCQCSRAHLEVKPCTCPQENLAFHPARSRVRIRLRVDPQTEKTVTLWRQEGFAAYQLVSLLDDLDHGITMIVRGQDLEESTQIQCALADRLGPGFHADRFRTIQFHHHPLLLGPGGRKLSKSEGADSLRSLYPRSSSPEVLHALLRPALEEFMSGGNSQSASSRYST